MDEEGFRSYLKRMGKKPHVVDGLVRQVARYEDFLLQRREETLERTEPGDVLDFAAHLEHQHPGAAGKSVRGLALYFRFAGRDDLVRTACDIREEAISAKRKPFTLRDFVGIPSEHVAGLESLGIRSAAQMLEAGRDPRSRAELATRTGVPPEVVLELVRLSDLSRISGVKAIRARLYHDAGVDSVDKMAAQDPEELLRLTAEFVQRTGFKGIPPLPKEIKSTIATARQLPKVVEY